MGRWVDRSGVIIKLNSVQLQLQLPAGTELGNVCHCRWSMTSQIPWSTFLFCLQPFPEARMAPGLTCLHRDWSTVHAYTETGVQFPYIHKYNSAKKSVCTTLHKYNWANKSVCTTLHKYNWAKKSVCTTLHKYNLACNFQHKIPRSYNN